MATKPFIPDLPVELFRTDAELAKWITKHPDATGVWIKFAKKGSGIQSINYDGALKVALCHGWIDGQTRSLDDTYYLQRFTPRRKRSMWSKRNVGLVAELIAAGRMTPAGQREIDAAKADGRWDRAYDSPKNTGVPEDLSAALAKNKKAARFFEEINKTNRFAICFRIQNAAKAETRAKRVAAMVEMLARGEVIHPAKAPAKKTKKKKARK